MRRVVLDTNVLTAGLRSRKGASFALLQMVATKRLIPLVTTALFLEYEAVLRRPTQVEVHGFSQTALDRFLAEFAALSEPVEVHFVWRPQLPDIDDELVLEAAINGHADALLTHNVRDFGEPAARLGVRVLTPGRALMEIMQ
jgi:putative PIN family toxin of toxin-antitoxin system